MLLCFRDSSVSPSLPTSCMNIQLHPGPHARQSCRHSFNHEPTSRQTDRPLFHFRVQLPVPLLDMMFRRKKHRNRKHTPSTRPTIPYPAELKTFRKKFAPMHPQKSPPPPTNPTPTPDPVTNMNHKSEQKIWKTYLPPC